MTGPGKKRAGQKPSNSVPSVTELSYNDDGNSRDVDGDHPEPPRRADGLAVVVPVEPPTIDPAAGAVLLRILLAARDRPGSGTSERRAA